MEINSSRAPRNPSLRFGPFTFDPRRHTLHRDGERLHLTSKQVETLAVLIANPCRLLRKQELLDAVWKDAAVTEDNLVQAIGEIRRVLGERKGDDRFIQTVHRQGYRFVASVEAVSADMLVPTIPTLPMKVPVDAPVTAPTRAPQSTSEWLSLAALGMVLMGVGLAFRFVTIERP